MDNRRPAKNREALLIAVFFVFGFLFRISLVASFPQPRIWDQDQYYGFALGMIREGWHADTVRLYGYPLIIVPFILFFGDSFQWYLTIFQSLLDCATAILVWMLGTRLFTKVSAWAGYIIYLANPYTAAYTGVILTEIIAIFLVTLIIYLLFRTISSRSIQLAIILALLLGFLPQVRPSFVYLTIIGLVFLLYLMRARIVKWATGTVLVFFYVLPFSYNIAVNVYRYQQLALQSVDNVFIREVYISLYINRAAPPGNMSFTWPDEVYAAWWDFSSATTPQGRAAMNEKYKTFVLNIIKRDPIGFVKSRVAKVWYVWEKHYLFPYIPQQGGRIITVVIYWVNVGLLTLAAGGFIQWYLTSAVTNNKILRHFGTVAVFVIVYISIAHIFSTSEERFSLPGYPMIFLFAGYAIIRLTTMLDKIYDRES